MFFNVAQYLPTRPNAHAQSGSQRRREFDFTFGAQRNRSRRATEDLQRTRSYVKHRRFSFHEEREIRLARKPPIFSQRAINPKPIAFHFLFVAEEHERLHGNVIGAANEKVQIVAATPSHCDPRASTHRVTETLIIASEEGLRFNVPARRGHRVLREGLSCNR